MLGSLEETFFNVVKEAVKNDDNVYVRGFGSFITKKRAAKKARNISQNTTIIIEEHFIPSFKPSKSFIDEVKISTSKK